MTSRWCGAVVLLVGAILAATWTTRPPSAAIASPPAPTIAITSPAAGSTVEGTIAITATATAGTGDYPTGINFYDGPKNIGSAGCQAPQPSCTDTVNLNGTGMSGQHTLTAQVSTNAGLSATSAPVVVTIVSPPPAVSITSPSAGATVEGNVTVSAAAETDPSQDDFPGNITFYDGFSRIGSVSCRQQEACQVSLTWNATGLSGTHALTAQVTTQTGVSATSAPVDVTVDSPGPTVEITSPVSGSPLEGSMTIEVTAATDPSQVDYPSGITVSYGVNHGIGNVRCQAQPTCSGSVQWNTTGLTGQQTLTAVVNTNTGRTATSAPVLVGKRLIAATCQLATLQVASGRKDGGKCKVPGVPAGTKVRIQYQNASGGWTTVVRGKVTRHGTFHFTVFAKQPATYQLSILVSGDRTYATTRVIIGTLVIT
ncbi:MAG: Ig-like domain-containing protein [Solirubrobacteraceae bacterium]|jgi:hypothetical protein